MSHGRLSVSPGDVEGASIRPSGEQIKGILLERSGGSGWFAPCKCPNFGWNSAQHAAAIFPILLTRLTHLSYYHSQ